MDDAAWQDYVARAVQRGDDAAADLRMLVTRVERLTRERDEARAALAGCIRLKDAIDAADYDFGEHFDAEVLAWAEARRIVALCEEKGAGG